MRCQQGNRRRNRFDGSFERLYPLIPFPDALKSSKLSAAFIGKACHGTGDCVVMVIGNGIMNSVDLINYTLDSTKADRTPRSGGLLLLNF